MLQVIKYLEKKEIFISIIILSISILFWDIKIQNLFQSKFLILLILPYFIIDTLKNNLNIKIIIGNLLMVIVIYIHLILNLITEISNYAIFSLIFLFLLSLISLRVTTNFEKILFESCKIFILIINFLILIDLFLSEYFLYDHIELKNGLCAIFTSENRIIIGPIFSESSHFGMTAVGVTLYLLLSFKNLNNFYKLNFVTFVLLTFIFFGSLTLYFGLIVTSLFILTLRLSKKYILLLSVIFLNTLIILNFDNCYLRISQIKDMKNVYSLKKFNKFDYVFEFFEKNFFNKIEKVLSIDKSKITNKDVNTILGNTDDKNDNEKNKFINITTIIHINHFNFAAETLQKKPLGVGFQNYMNYAIEYAMEEKFILTYSNQKFMNINDGASNLNKLVTEFGYLNILFGILFIIILFKSKFSNQTKCFILGIVLTQLIRGAGYFNGGFLFVILILFYSNVTKINNYDHSKI